MTCAPHNIPPGPFSLSLSLTGLFADYLRSNLWLLVMTVALFALLLLRLTWGVPPSGTKAIGTATLVVVWVTIWVGPPLAAPGRGFPLAIAVLIAFKHQLFLNADWCWHSTGFTLKCCP